MVRVRRENQVIGALADQVASSGTNFAVGVLAARRLSDSEFGKFAVFLSVVSVGIIVTRSLLTEPIVMKLRQYEISKNEWSSTALFGLLAWSSVGSVVLALFYGFSLPSRTLAGFCVAGLVVVNFQDILRYILISSGAPWSAALIDLLWGTVTVVSVLVARGDRIEVFVLAFVLGALASALFALVLGSLPIRSDLRRFVHDLRVNAGTSGLLFVEAIASKGSLQFLNMIVAFVLGYGNAAAFRTANLAFAPMGVLCGGVGTALAPRLARMERAKAMSSVRPALKISAVLGVVAAGFGLAMYSGELGTHVFGSAWSSARSLAVPLGLASVLNSANSVLSIGLRVRGRAGRATSGSLSVAVFATLSVLVLFVSRSLFAATWVLVAGSILWIGTNFAAQQKRS